MITRDDYFGHMSRALEAEPDAETERNAADLLDRVNALLEEIDLPEAQSPHVNSGWRSPAYNAKVPNAAPRSKHITGQAIDLADPEGALDDYLMERLDLLEKHGLYLEHPLSTKSWTHLQSVPPRSGNRVFYP